MSDSLPRRCTLSALLVLLLTAIPLTAQRAATDPDRVSVRVDCTRGGSIKNALQMFPERTEQITIEITGLSPGWAPGRKPERVGSHPAALEPGSALPVAADNRATGR